MLEYALTYHALGYQVMPGRPDKRPRLTEWKRLQTTRNTEEQVREWWGRWPDATILVITGAISGGLLVIDKDAGATWPDDADRLFSLSAAPRVKTGGGGCHWYFQMPRGESFGNTVSALAHHVDTRGEGGYVVAPPSSHPSGGLYEWIEPLEQSAGDLPPVDEWIAHDLRTEIRRAAAATTVEEYEKLLGEGVSEGERNATAARLAGRYLSAGLGRGEILAILGAWNAHNVPPMPDAELEKVVTSIAQRELMKAGAGEIKQASTEAERGELLKTVSEKFDIDLRKAVWVAGDEPYFEFTIGEQVVTMPGPYIATEALWRKTIAGVCEGIPQRLPRKEAHLWRDFGNMIAAAAHKVQPESGSTLAGQCKFWVEDFLNLRAEQIPEMGEQETPTMTVKQNGFVYINPTDLLRFVKGTQGANVSPQKMAQLLAKHDIKRIKCKVKYLYVDENSNEMRTAVRGFYKVKLP